tara:strand:- start:2008 stop:2505 length:498 start_codon:yes stop_codon:yes gene_type:complete
MEAHLKQFERVKRYLDRLKKIYEGTHNPGSSEEYEDEVVSFFIHCYHVGDWILHLSKVPVSKLDISNFINSHDELKICADFCNGEKHCRLTQTKRTDGQPHLAYRAYSVCHYMPASGIPSTYKASYKIISGCEAYDALELAEKCVLLWEEYISSLQSEYNIQREK